jgi:replicative DNA helicase
MVLQEDKLRQLGFNKINVAYEEALKIIKERSQGLNLPLKTKWSKYNNYLNGGIEKGVIQIIGGRPGSGKSAFTNKMLFDLFEANPTKKMIILYFNFEMTAYMQVMREVSSLTRLKVSELLSSNSRLEETALRNIEALRRQMSDFEIYFHDIPCSVSDIEVKIANVTEIFKDHHIITVIDHTRLVRAGNEATEQARLDKLAGSTIFMAKQYDISYIILSQLNRNIETPERALSLYVPQLSDLFGSDSIGQAAHVVSIINRPEMYQLSTYLENEPAENLLALHLVKNRNGSVLWIPFTHNLSINQLVERS